MPIVCHQVPVLAGSATLATMGTLILCLGKPASYGKHCESASSGVPLLPARIAWFLQELPSFVVSVGMLAWQPRSLFGPPGNVLLGLFSAHYFHRLAFSPQSMGSLLGSRARTNVEGQREEWGVARSEAGLELQAGTSGWNAQGWEAPAGQETPSLSLGPPSDAPGGCEGGWLKLGNSLWAGAIGQGPFPSSCSPGNCLLCL